MGGKGSGRKVDPAKQFLAERTDFVKPTGAAPLELPNYSGVKRDLQKGQITLGTAGSVLFLSSTGHITENNSNLFWDDTNNRLGIGTASPSSALDVLGNIEIPAGNKIILDSDGGSDSYISYSASAVHFFEDGTEGITIKSGSVGMGTDSPSSPLHVYHATTDFIARFKSGDNKAGIMIIDDDTTNYVISQDGYMSLGSNNALNAGNLNIKSTGNVGIGTTSPGEKLSVQGNLTLDVGGGLSNDYGKSLFFTVDASPVKVAGIRMKEHTTNNYGLEFQTYSGGLGTRMTILGDGNVGIGTSSPLSILDLDEGGNSWANSIILRHDEGSTGWNIHPESNTEDSLWFGYNSDTSGATAVAKMVIEGTTGNVGIGTTSPNETLTIEAGVVSIKETTTPTATTNYGKVYTKSDNKLYFQDGAGTEHEIAFV